jgi:hypothetical protein
MNGDEVTWAVILYIIVALVGAFWRDYRDDDASTFYLLGAFLTPLIAGFIFFVIYIAIQEFHSRVRGFIVAGLVLFVIGLISWAADH